MDFDMFDKTELNKYREEAKARWGSTEAWQESERKTAGRDMGAVNEGLMAQFSALGALKQLAPEDPQVQAAVAALQQFITDNYYTCTKQILAGLGQMYVADERFTKNIDAAGGPGTAAFAAKAIEIFCK